MNENEGGMQDRSHAGENEMKTDRCDSLDSMTLSTVLQPGMQPINSLKKLGTEIPVNSINSVPSTKSANALKKTVVLVNESSSPFHDNSKKFDFEFSASKNTKTFNQFSSSFKSKFTDESAAGSKGTVASAHFTSSNNSSRSGSNNNSNDSINLISNPISATTSLMMSTSNQKIRRPKIQSESSYYSASNPNRKFIPVFIPPKPNNSGKLLAKPATLGTASSSSIPLLSIPSEEPSILNENSSSEELENVSAKRPRLMKKSDLKKRLVVSPDSPDPLTSNLNIDYPPRKMKKPVIIEIDDEDEEGDMSIPMVEQVVEQDRVFIQESTNEPKNNHNEISTTSRISSSQADEHTSDDDNSLAVDFEVVSFLNIAQNSELIDCLQCTSEQSSFILQNRPQETISVWLEKCAEFSTSLASKVKKYRLILQEMGNVDEIIKKCDDLATEIKGVLDEWEVYRKTGKNPNPNTKYEFMASQSSIINPKFKLKGYQLIGVSWMLMLYEKKLGGILADEMGLGKTAQIVSFLGALLERKEEGPHLIIVPSSTLDNWMREIKMWCPTLEAIAYTGSLPERRSLQYDIKENVDLNIIVTTYNIATGNSEDRRFLRSTKCKTLFLDEGHMIKNDNSNRTKHLKNLDIPFIMLITGTPLQNNLMELLSLLTFIMPDIFNPAYETFASIFDLKNSNNRLEDEVSKRRLERAGKIMNPFVLRRRKEDVLNDIPPKTRKIIYCSMSKAQKSVYQKILLDSKKKYIDSTEESNAKARKTKKDVQKSNNTLSNVMMELRKAADHQLLIRTIYSDEKLPSMATDIMKELEFMDSTHSYVVEDMSTMSDFQLHKLCSQYPNVHKYKLEESDWMDSGKVQQLSTLLPELIEKGDKILIFSQFVIMLDILELIMDTLKIKFLRLDGSTPGNERIGLIDLYNGSLEIRVFLLSTKACGLGINLTSANVVILYDIDFNPHNDAQAEDRAHRVGQTRPVTIYKFICEGSIEQHMLTCANFKLLLDNKVQERDVDIPETDKANEEKLFDLVKNDIMKES